MSGPLLGYSYSATGPERSRKWIIIHHVKVFPIYPCSSSSRPEQPKLISKQTFLEISDWSGQGVRASRTMKHWEHLVELPTPQMNPLLDNTICQSIKNFHERTKKEVRNTTIWIWINLPGLNFKLTLWIVPFKYTAYAVKTRTLAQLNTITQYLKNIFSCKI